MATPAKQKQLSTRISDQAAEFYAATFDNRHAGATLVLEAFQSLYKLTLARELKGIFTADELNLMLDVNNGLILTPQILGQHMSIQVSDGCTLDHLDEKWGIKATALQAKIEKLSLFQCACLEIFCSSFWQSGAHEKENALWEYIKPLL